MRHLIRHGLTRTAALWPDIERVYGWVHRAAHILSNEAGEIATMVQRRFDGLLRAMTRHRASAGDLTEAVNHFCKVAHSYRPGLFHCQAVPDPPRTDSGLEQLFGSQRYHERRASRRKVAPPATVLRGEVRLIAATATRLHLPTAGSAEIAGGSSMPGSINAARPERWAPAFGATPKPTPPLWSSRPASQLCRPSHFCQAASG